MDRGETAGSPSLSDLPLDELISYGQSLGLALSDDSSHGEALRLVRARQELLLGLDRTAMLDIVMWLRLPVRRSASKEQLAAAISGHHRVRFAGLSDRGLEALARLSGVKTAEGETRAEMERRLRKAEGLGARIKRVRRAVVGSIVSKILSSSGVSDDPEYRFLPEEGAGPSLKQEIEETGLVSGVARRLRGVADDYVTEKLDEIERRIDRKLDEIDQRLAEWRDREVTHRLRIIKVTLVFTILVAVLSLLYDYFQP